MRKWIVRFAALYVFNALVLLVIGLIMGSVQVGLAALWASVILTLAAMFLKPWITKLFQRRAARTAGRRTKLGEWIVQGGLMFVVALLIWLLVVWLSPVAVHGWFWWWFLPPIVLLIAWAIYAAIVEWLEARTGELYDRATGKAPATDAAASRPETEGTDRRELHDGLTPEQRKMLDDLGDG
jgi:small-conductance mechanosensitive channel